MSSSRLLRSSRTGLVKPAAWSSPKCRDSITRRYLSHNSHERLSSFWIPTGGIAKDEASDGSEDSHALLVRGGFLRQSHAGLFQFLPMGLRVQQKVESLVERYMRNIGASKLSLSTLSSQDLWRRSGRLQGDKSELFRLEDRKGAGFLLSPTHEEEITALVSGLVHSYRDLPVRAFQITRKYRDELRPRQGLLRAREFLMKDLYTFDVTESQALATYEEVRQAYRNIFNELKIPYVVAEADSGSIGGDLSHEYHIASSKGEDELLVCSSCSHTVNTEILDRKSTDRPKAGLECGKCGSEELEAVKSIELGHTFHLGTKYSDPLEALVTPKDSTQPVPMQMGCHGIGITRVIGAAAAVLADAGGLNWPRAIAPFEAVVIPASGLEADAEKIAGALSETSDGKSPVDAVLDDRSKAISWKLKDADLIGYPVVVVVGKAWKAGGEQVEVQCRRLGIKQDVNVTALKSMVSQCLRPL